MGLSIKQSLELIELCSNWGAAEASPGSISNPASNEYKSLAWFEAKVPGTVACQKALVVEGKDFDDSDWWYQCEFDMTTEEEGTKKYLRMDGLASLADIWLNGEYLCNSKNMFVGFRIDVSEICQQKNQLVICFRSLAAELKHKRPRPRWKTKLVSNQNLRWYRTTLLGRISSWYPKVSAVGPWQPVYLENLKTIELVATQLNTTLNGSKGLLHGNVAVKILDPGVTLEKVTLIVDSQEFPQQFARDTAAKSDISIELGCEIENVSKWWPHTHGEPYLYDCFLLLETNEAAYRFKLGRRGFKSIKLIQDEQNCGLAINNVDVFCRGAIWSSNDIVSLRGDQEGTRRALILAKQAGINMIRIGGTMCYETDEFYQFCDELGIMLWQDFMFVCMDYPLDDDDFRANAVAEIRAQVSRLSSHESICVYCGNSEVQQQAAMVGAPKEIWSHEFYDHQIRDICEEIHPGIPYFSSTPSGGALPFHPNVGLAHYYGVGAFMLPLSDLYQANIKFSPESMGFSHVPEPAVINKIFNNETPALHDPRWKTVLPRDAGTGWDFDDVRDHYFRELYKQDPINLRCYDPERYLEISRVVSGEVHYRVFSHLRSSGHPCRGALLWYYNDLVLGPGWGMIDSEKNPKAAYYAVKKAFRSLGVFIEDRGLNGLYLNLINESAETRNCVIDIRAYKEGDILTLEGNKQISLSTRENSSISVDGMLEYFSDVSYAYKFGPLQHIIFYARLSDADSGEYLDDCTFFPVTYTLPNHITVDLDVKLVRRDTGNYVLYLSSPVFLQFVRLDLKSLNVEDNYFHLAPNFTREIVLLDENFDPIKSTESIKVKGFLEAINLREPIRIRLDSEEY